MFLFLWFTTLTIGGAVAVTGSVVSMFMSGTFGLRDHLVSGT